MKMDYSKASELLNQDVEKEERNKMAEKAVHDNLYNRGFRDGLAVLDKIRAKIEAKCCITVGRENDGAITLHDVFEIFDKYKAESVAKK